MTAPIPMTEFCLNALYGWPREDALEFVTTYDPSLASTFVPPGACVHLSSAGQYLLGVGNLEVMPLFMFSGSDDLDVVNDGGDPATQRGAYVAVSPIGMALSLVATGAYELVDTNFVEDTYAPNDHLTSPTTGVNAGALEKGTLWTNTICGIVSRGIVDNGYGFQALAFWPIYLPPMPAS